MLYMPDSPPCDATDYDLPILFINDEGKLDAVNIEMIKAYVPEAGDMTLEAAAQLAAVRDEVNAENLLMSFIDIEGASLSILL